MSQFIPRVLRILLTVYQHRRSRSLRLSLQPSFRVSMESHLHERTEVRSERLKPHGAVLQLHQISFPRSTTLNSLLTAVLARPQRQRYTKSAVVLWRVAHLPFPVHANTARAILSLKIFLHLPLQILFSAQSDLRLHQQLTLHFELL